MDVRKGENMEEKVSGLGRSDILKAGRGASIKLAGDTQLISYAQLIMASTMLDSPSTQRSALSRSAFGQ